MYNKRRPVKAVYGRGRIADQANILWDEAIAASPIRDILGSADANIIAPWQPSIARKKASAARLSTTSVTHAVESEALESMQTPDKVETMKVSEHYLTPLLASTPCTKSQSSSRAGRNVMASHIRFSSSELSFRDDSSPIVKEQRVIHISVDHDSDSLLSFASEDSVADLTTAFEKLESVPHDSKDVSNRSIADIADLTDIQSLLRLCKQESCYNFSDFILHRISDGTLVKLGEASYSEVFLGTSVVDEEQTVYKIIPFGSSPEEVPIKDVMQELRISSAMSSVSGFVKLKGMTVVEGRYPDKLLELWDEWNDIHDSESDRPDWYTSSQKYCIIALENGGRDLEHFKLKTWEESLTLFREITETLATGEDKYEFEHRDLHWGNVLVKDEVIPGETRITIIDYTLSRALVTDEFSEIAYNAFADEAIFEAEGDDYQFDIYRLMREVVHDADGNGSEDWTKFHPTTNALWLHYLLDKFMFSKDLVKPALRRSKRNPVLMESEVEAWLKMDRMWKMLDPQRKYKPGEHAIDSAYRVLELLNA